MFKAAALKWRPIETAPKDGGVSFLVLLPGNSMASQIVLQVSLFENRLYSDHADANIDWSDGITTATHWMPLPDAPRKIAILHMTHLSRQQQGGKTGEPNGN